MSEFSNVTVKREANVYFDGQVVSRTLTLEDGSTKTLGFIQPGEYTFNTEDKELIEILSGEAEVIFTDTGNWQAFRKGAIFEVSANSSFTIKALTLVDYCCSFIPE